jgi:predicted GNAT family N-acyltransferase
MAREDVNSDRREVWEGDKMGMVEALYSRLIDMSSPGRKMKAVVRIRRISSNEELQRAFAIRMRVFVREQGVPARLELDREDQCAIHLLATASGKAVGTARVVLRRRNAKIGRMAVVRSYRRKGIGKKLLQRAIITAIKLGAEKIYLHAQVPVIGFYELLGFYSVGPVFDEAEIPHRKMIFKAQATDKRQQLIKRR